MDREILFRAKRKDNGEWEYGYYCNIGYTGQERPYIIPVYASAFYGIEVNPSTVGQYTGLTDTKKHKAFGDDIVCYKGTHTVYGIIRYGEIHDREGRLNHIGYYIEWQNDGANMWGDWWRSDLGYWLTEPNCEICSNVHDNPELIGGEDDG